MKLEWNHLETVSSTNTWLAGLARARGPGQEIAVMADFQSDGKGQGANSWISDRGENLLMSVLLFPEFLSASAQFYLSVITSLAICDLIRDAVSAPAIKWPNDILSGYGKIAGILIENSIMGGDLSYSVIGIGLNVNQGRFPEFPWRATSMAMETGRHYDPSHLADGLADHLLKNYDLLRRGAGEQLRNAYLDHLYMKDKPAGFLAAGRTFTGIIRGIGEFGELMVESEGKVRLYGMEEIRMNPN